MQTSSIIPVETTDFLSLERSVCENPADDFPRLAYADWLEEHGVQWRANLIRVQLELETLAENDPRRKKMLLESSSLVEHIARLPGWTNICWYSNSQQRLLIFEKAWGVSEPRDRCSMKLRRGFGCSVTMPEKRFLADAEDLFSSQPIEEVYLWGKKSNDLVGGHWWRRSERQVETGSGVWIVDRPEESDVIPSVILDSLDKKTQQSTLGPHSTEADAILALSRACVSFGRAAAGLLPLAEPTK